jgi:hypothetical protein
MSSRDGVITTFENYLDAGQSSTVRVVNSRVNLTSVVLVSVSDYSGAGIPVVRAIVISNGFLVTVTNVHSTEGVGRLKIAFLIA